jgi:RNA 3'-terminal phosphate cyclase
MHILNGLSGGGQMLRTALTLSMITGEAFRMTLESAVGKRMGGASGSGGG